MINLLKMGTSFWKQPLAPKPISARTYPVLDAYLPLEEERLPHYDAADWYPVFIGEVFLSNTKFLASSALVSTLPSGFRGICSKSRTAELGAWLTP